MRITQNQLRKIIREELKVRTASESLNEVGFPGYPKTNLEKQGEIYGARGLEGGGWIHGTQDQPQLTVKYVDWENKWDQTLWTLLINGEEVTTMATGSSNAMDVAGDAVSAWMEQQVPPIDDPNDDLWAEMRDDAIEQLTSQPEFLQAVKESDDQITQYGEDMYRTDW